MWGGGSENDEMRDFKIFMQFYLLAATAKNNNNNNNNNSIQFFIIYVPGQQSNGQLQTEHSLDAGIYIIDKHKLQASTDGGKEKSTNNSNNNKFH
jgi:hypothetical protein